VGECDAHVAALEERVHGHQPVTGADLAEIFEKEIVLS
jgi:hypothetical protein